MSAAEIRMPAAIAWLFFAPGVVFVLVDIVLPPWQPTGLSVIGVVFLLLWAYLIGVFTAEFWNRAPKSTVEGASCSDPHALAPSTVPTVEVER